MNQNRKLGRNEQCWCGSGKKYKRCHLNRENEEPVRSWESEAALRREFSTKSCGAPDALKANCSKQIAKADTVPKSGSLERIARNGHVYSFVPSFQDLTKNNGRLVPVLNGINYASTFTGFCSKHDDAIFAPIEKTHFSGTPEQCFLLGFRSLAREEYTKQAQAASVARLRQQADRGRSKGEQSAIQRFLFSYNTGIAAGVRDTNYYKSKYDQILVQRQFDVVRAYIIEIDGPPTVMCSGGVFPEQDFEGNVLQDLSDLKTTPFIINFASFYGGERGAVVFTWLPESDSTCRVFIKNLDCIPDAALTDGLLRFFFEFCENVHMQPEWWETLAGTTREAIINRMTTFAKPTIGPLPGCLKDDGVRFPAWEIVRRHFVNFTV